MSASSRETVLCRYGYDPLDRQTDCMLLSSPAIRRFYRKSRLATEIQGALQTSVFQHDDQLLAQRWQLDGNVDTMLLMTDQQRSVLGARGLAGSHLLAYTPYGHRPAENGLLSLLGFNGERPDPTTGHYHLGNGYRQFNPVLMRFNSPDSWSPFGDGGLNAYAYCDGDPRNRTDPTGHFSWPGLPKIFGDSLLNSVAKVFRKADTVSDPLKNSLTNLKNLKPNLIDYESQIANWAIKDGKALITKINSQSDLQILKNHNYKYKFILTNKHEFVIGGIKKGANTKILSHPVIASNANSGVIISAGYIRKQGKKIIVINNSGHFHPKFSHLTAIQEHLKTLNTKTSKIRHGSANDYIYRVIR